MDWWTSLAASIALLWIFCFIDGKRQWLVGILKLFRHFVAPVCYHMAETAVINSQQKK